MHLEVRALIRSVTAAGGGAMVLQRGEPDAGTLLLVLQHRNGARRVYERMPQLDGGAVWTCTRRGVADEDPSIDDYVTRRGNQDADLWIVELDVVQAERFIGLPTAPD